MENKYLEKIAKTLSEKELNREAWKSTGIGALGSTAGGIVLPVVGQFAGDHFATKYHLNKLAPKANHKDASNVWGKGLLYGMGGALTGGVAGTAVGALAKNPMASIIGGGIGALSGGIYANKTGRKSGLRRVLKKYQDADSSAEQG